MAALSLQRCRTAPGVAFRRKARHKGVAVFAIASPASKRRLNASATRSSKRMSPWGQCQVHKINDLWSSFRSGGSGSRNSLLHRFTESVFVCKCAHLRFRVRLSEKPPDMHLLAFNAIEYMRDEFPQH